MSVREKGGARQALATVAARAPEGGRARGRWPCAARVAILGVGERDDARVVGVVSGGRRACVLPAVAMRALVTTRALCVTTKDECHLLSGAKGARHRRRHIWKAGPRPARRRPARPR